MTRPRCRSARGTLAVAVVIPLDQPGDRVADRGGELHVGGGGHEEPEVAVEAAAVENLAELFLVGAIEE